MHRTRSLIFLALAFGLTARAQTSIDPTENLTTRDTVSVTVGCWNPAVCDDPATYWSEWGMNVPAIEPPAADFAPVGEPEPINWSGPDAPEWFRDTPLVPVEFERTDPPVVLCDSHHDSPSPTPEPGSASLFLLGTALISLGSILRRKLSP